METDHPFDAGFEPADLATSPSEFQTQHESTRKKRKAWGQPIPDFKVVLPPRKRAKTAEEKEQRKHERVIRNRKAADKSRQRQKAAVAELEVKTARIEQENANLRNALEIYRSKFGELPGVAVPTLSLDPPATDRLPATPSTFTVTSEVPSLSTASTPGPMLAYDSPTPTASIHDSSLSPGLFLVNDEVPLDLKTEHQFSPVPDFSLDSRMTQYPAAILCDLQCQQESREESVELVESSRSPSLKFLFSYLTTILTIYETFYNTMLMPMCRLFPILGSSSSMSLHEQAFLDQNFPLILSLISTPSSPTTRPIFRMKLLSRLLACSPSTARLLKAATDRALQRLVSEGAILDSADGSRRWASLLTIRFAIERLEKEHQRYRRIVDVPASVGEPVPGLARQIGLIKKMEGVDYLAVEKSLWRWRSQNGITPLGGIAVTPSSVY